MIESKSFGSKAFKVINAIILILLAFSCFYPLWYTFCVSISSKAAAEGGLVTVYPIGPNVKSYSLILGDTAEEVHHKEYVEYRNRTSQNQRCHGIDHTIVFNGDEPRNGTTIEQHTEYQDPHQTSCHRNRMDHGCPDHDVLSAAMVSIIP